MYMCMSARACVGDIWRLIYEYKSSSASKLVCNDTEMWKQNTELLTPCCKGYLVKQTKEPLGLFCALWA